MVCRTQWRLSRADRNGLAVLTVKQNSRRRGAREADRAVSRLVGHRVRDLHVAGSDEPAFLGIAESEVPHSVVVTHLRCMDPPRDERCVRCIEVVNVKADRRRRDVETHLAAHQGEKPARPIP